MPGITKYNAAGFTILEWSYIATSGYITGAANLTAANVGISSSVARHRGANTADFSLPAPTVVNIPGDDTTRAIFQFDGDGLPTFVLEMSDKDNAFYAAALGLASVTDGDWQATPVAASGVTGNALFLKLSRRLKSQTAGQVGAAGYEHLVLPRCEAKPLGSGYGTKAAAVWRWQITVNNTDTMPDGRTVASVFADAPSGEITGFNVTTDYFWTYSSFVGDNAITSPVLAQKPISTAKTKATVETTGFASGTVSAVDTTTPYGYTLSAAPGTGKFAIARHEHLLYE